MRKPLWTYLACCIAVFMISMDNLIVTNALTGAAYAARWRASAAGVRPESRPHSLVRWAWSA